MNIAKLYDTIRAPIITEKATRIGEENKVVLLVQIDSTKATIKAAVEKIYNTKVIAVNTIKVKGKTKKFKGREGKRSDYKKAIVTIEKGKSIDILGGV